MQTFTGLLGSLNNSLRYSSTRGAAILSGSDPPMSRQTYLNFKEIHVNMCKKKFLFVQSFLHIFSSNINN